MLFVFVGSPTITWFTSTSLILTTLSWSKDLAQQKEKHYGNVVVLALILGHYMLTKLTTAIDHKYV